MSSLDLPGAEATFADSRFGAQGFARLRAGFVRSRHPMLIIDDLRRVVTANPAACEMLRSPADEICWLSMEVFTPPGEHTRLASQWGAFLSSGAAEGTYALAVPGQDQPVPVEFSATANVLPARHLLVFVAPDESADDAAKGAAPAWAPVATDAGGRLPLTEREREVMTLVASGHQSGDIAERLFLSPETVKSHVNNAMGKLGSHTRAHAVALALATGQISWDSDGPSGQAEVVRAR